MKIESKDIICEESIQVSRNTQGCDYTHNGMFLFHERTTFPHNPFKNIYIRQLFLQFGMTKAECDELIKPYGEFAISTEHMYSDGIYYPCFLDSDKAIEFCNSEQFEILTKSLEKV